MAARFSAVQAEVLKRGGRLSGSRAFGTPRPDSDWDYWLPSRQIRPFWRWLNQQEQPWESPLVGAVTCYPDGVMVEVSCWFPRNKRHHEQRKD